MNYDPELAALLSQPWSNNACRGYVIYAMENCGFRPRTSGVWWLSSMRSLTSVDWKRLSSTTSGVPTDFWTLCPQVRQGTTPASETVLALFVSHVTMGNLFTSTRQREEVVYAKGDSGFCHRRI